MNQNKIKIIASGQYLPKEKVDSSDLDRRLGVVEGTCFRSSGVKTRYYADVVTEPTAKMAALAVQQALDEAGLKFEDLDALVCTSATIQQTIPYNASLIQRELGKSESGVPAFDMNTTCLSFVTGLDTISYLMEAGRYSRVMLVATENASNGLNPQDIHTHSLFGDGACAVLIERTPSGESSKILAAGMETYSEGADMCRLLAGGTLIHPRHHGKKDYASNFFFEMDGRQVIRLALEKVPPFINRLLEKATLTLDQIDYFIPHQASKTGMEILRRRLDIPENKWMNILEDHGNMIAVSIPLALRQAMLQKKLKRGMKVMLMGTSAGFSVGGLILEF
jgi:3-oxoacyl-[acyl-carrier-protein] synthase-3